MSTGNFLLTGWGALASGAITAVAAVSVGRWSQTSHKAKWESLKAQMEILEKLEDSDPMRGWMDRFVQVEIRNHAKRSIDIRLDVRQWALVSMPILAIAFLLYRLIDTYVTSRTSYPEGTVGYGLCEEKGIHPDFCISDSLNPEFLDRAVSNTIIGICASILTMLFLYVALMSINKRDRRKLSSFAAFFQSKRQSGTPMIELASAMPDLPRWSSAALQDTDGGDAASTSAPSED